MNKFSDSLPFNELSDREFNFVNGIWSNMLDHSDTDVFNIIPNPDKFNENENDPDSMLTTPSSNYYTIDQINNSTDLSGPKAFSLFHCNVRSFTKNLDLLNGLLYSLNKRPDILGITAETKLNKNNVSNVDIPNYKFYHTDSQTAAGGSAIYVYKHLKSSPRLDIKFAMQLVESCWVEIDPSKGKSKIIIGCIYRHTNANMEQFTDQLDEILKQLHQSKKKCLY